MVAGLADDLAARSQLVAREQRASDEVEVERVGRRATASAVAQAAQAARTAQLVDQAVSSPLWHQLLDPVVGAGRLADQQRAEEDRRDDGHDR